MCHSFKYIMPFFRLLLPTFCAVYLRNGVLCWFQYLLREMFYSLDGFSVFIFSHVLWYSVSVSILGLHFFSVERVQPCKSLSSLLLFMLLAFNLHLKLHAILMSKATSASMERYCTVSTFVSDFSDHKAHLKSFNWLKNRKCAS